MAAALFVVAPELLSKLKGQSVIHGEQAFTWNRALEIGSWLSVTGSVTRSSGASILRRGAIPVRRAVRLCFFEPRLDPRDQACGVVADADPGEVGPAIAFLAKTGDRFEETLFGPDEH